jgi:hypothetical protein
VLATVVLGLSWIRAATHTGPPPSAPVVVVASAPPPAPPTSPPAPAPAAEDTTLALPATREPEELPRPTPTEARPSPQRVSSTLAVSAARGWAEVTLDGRRLGATPVMRVALRTGTHLLVARNDALGREARATFDASADTHVHAVVDLEASPPRITVRAR